LEGVKKFVGIFRGGGRSTRKGWRGEELGQRDEGVNSKQKKKVKDI
jgi:hypothetical protein